MPPDRPKKTSSDRVRKHRQRKRALQAFHLADETVGETLRSRRGRWHSYAAEGRIFCGPRPGGHHIPATYDLPESGFIRCGHWVAEERRECGRWVFLYAIRGGRVVVVEVTLADKKAMRQLSTPAEMIEYLGILDR